MLFETTMSVAAATVVNLNTTTLPPISLQVMSPVRPDSPYADSVTDEDLQPSNISEVLLECFAGSERLTAV